MSSTAAGAAVSRCADLDALRGFAMLLGIALHAALSFFPSPWPVHDVRQSRWLGLFVVAVHGFRMPLFFLLSGFFTMLVFRRRGLRHLLARRTSRILLPLLLGVVTILPLDAAVKRAVGGPARAAADRFIAEKPAPPVAVVAGRESLAVERESLAAGRESWTARYRAFLASDRFRIPLGGSSWHLFKTPLFDHLWFLWHLCWLIAAFAAAARAGCAPTGRWMWWLVPASLIPQSFMGSAFGPDTSVALLPPPHLLLYYGCFFWFGAAACAATDGSHAADTAAMAGLGRRWKPLLAMAVIVLLPAVLVTAAQRNAATILQPAYAWSMSLGMIGLFHRWFSRPSGTVRWLADASYWMYLAHLPLVFLTQFVVRDWPWPVAVKFPLVVAVVTVVLLASYRWLVRDTLLGRLLDGPRPAAAPVTP